MWSQNVVQYEHNGIILKCRVLLLLLLRRTQILSSGWHTQLDEKGLSICLTPLFSWYTHHTYTHICPILVKLACGAQRLGPAQTRKCMSSTISVSYARRHPHSHKQTSTHANIAPKLGSSSLFLSHYENRQTSTPLTEHYRTYPLLSREPYMTRQFWNVACNTFHA